MDNTTEIQPPVQVVQRNAWLKVLAIAVDFYIILLAALLLTHNSNLFPILVMVGSFMVPLAYVAFFYERRHFSQLTLPKISQTFIFGGLVGVIAASILEPFFIRQLDLVSVLKVGFIEEFVKILGVLLITRNLRRDLEMDGLILGAAAGMGFAALESSGYAFTAFLVSNGSISATVIVTLIRGLLSPLGQGTWTASLISVLFRESKDGRLHINL